MSQFHFDPATYMDVMRREIPHYATLQTTIAQATASVEAESILDLGSGTGNTLAHVLALHPAARVVGVDENDSMLSVARAQLSAYEVDLRVADLRDPLPEGPFDLVISALAVHHLDGAEKAALFARIAVVLRPHGRLVLGDLVIPDDLAGVVTPTTDDYDKPSTVADQVHWMEEAGLVATVVWQRDDLAVFSADRSG